MILVFAPKSTSRLRYILRLMLSELLGLEFKITLNADDFRSYAGPKFTYARNLEGDYLHLAASDMLFEKGIGNPELQSIEHDGVKALFPVYDRNAALPYDPLASAFFMVTRYEEYMPYRKDAFGRFTASESLAHKMGFLHKPVVNHWARHLGDLLKKQFRDLGIKQHRFSFLPTYDIDQAWAYKEKGFIRTTGAYLKSLLSGNFDELVKRTKVISGVEPDPFDTFDYQLDLQKKFQLHPIYFILFARYAEFDKNISTVNTAFRQLIKHLADYADTGIHPSYASNNDSQALAREIKELSKVLNKEIICSRQHYLTLRLPETYRKLADFDITIDHTMGFSDLPGFRAGISTPFQFYDVDMETVLPVTVIPFAVMDGTLRDYMNLTPDAAIKTIHQLIEEVKLLGGVFSSLWHNESLSETGRWVGWRRVYEELVKKAVE